MAFATLSTASGGIMLRLVAVMALFVAPVVQGQGAIIGNGNVAVGVGESGALEVPYRGVPALGLPDEDPLFGEFLLRSQDGITDGLFGEGWGAGVRSNGAFMDVCGATENDLFGTTGLQNIEILDFRGVDGDPRVRADSTVKCGSLGLLKIRHQFRSAEGRNGCENAFEVRVTVDNLACGPVGDVIYRRNSDPDVDADSGDDVFTILGDDEYFFDLGANSLECGVLPSDPCPPDEIVFDGTDLQPPITNVGPFDQGAVIQINLGEIAQGGRKQFRFYWGLFDNPDAAAACIDGARMNLFATAVDEETQDTALLGFRRSITTGSSGITGCTNWDGAAGSMPAAAKAMSADEAAAYKEEKKGSR